MPLDKAAICDRLPTLIEILESLESVPFAAKYAKPLVRIVTLADSLYCGRPTVFGADSISEEEQQAAEDLAAKWTAECPCDTPDP